MNYEQLKLQLMASYCNIGWRILPTWWVTTDENGTHCACQLGTMCRKPGKHPRIPDWQHRATSDVLLVEEWHARWPLANWGWVQDKTFAIDIDAQRGGLTSLGEWEEASGGPWSTLTQETASGGLHMVYRQPNDGEVPQVSDFMPGIEVRGIGSYIMIEPSVGVNGSWQFRNSGSGDVESYTYAYALAELIVDCDVDTLTLIRRHQGGTVTRDGSGGRVSDSTRTSDLPATATFLERGFGFHTGSRNVDAYRLAWRLLALVDRDIDFTLDHVKQLMYAIWQVTPQAEHPFPWEEVINALNSAYTRRERQRPEEMRLFEQQRMLASRLVAATDKNEGPA